METCKHYGQKQGVALRTGTLAHGKERSTDPGNQGGPANRPTVSASANSQEVLIGSIAEHQSKAMFLELAGIAAASIVVGLLTLPVAPAESRPAEIRTLIRVIDWDEVRRGRVVRA